MGVRISHDRYGIPAKLDDAAVHGGGSGAELFVVEGDSAAASVSRVRDPRFQAVLPMQGKPLNAVKASRQKVVSHAFFGPLIAALGTGIDADFRLGGLRYDRVLLLMDPDADGIHCGVLMLLFLLESENTNFHIKPHHICINNQIHFADVVKNRSTTHLKY